MLKPQKSLSNLNRLLLILSVVLIGLYFFQIFHITTFNGLIPLLPWLLLIAIVALTITFFVNRSTVLRWTVGTVIAVLVIFSVFRYFAPQSWPWGTIVISLPLWVIAISAASAIIIIALLRSSTGQSIESIFKSDLGREAEKLTVTFTDVGGQENAKEALKPVIDWLKAPQTKVLGSEIPRGTLFTGPSGSGKTLFARAIAGEAGVAFFHYNGSEFIEILAGVAARRVRSLFSDAREAAKKQPCIVFIDQIDLIGGEHTAFPIHLGSNSEMHQALAQLLLELDNPKNERVYVLAATSRPRVLDPVLTTPGRLSLRIDLQLPDKGTRRKILDTHLKVRLTKYDMDLDELELDNIAANTEGWSGAELAQMVADAAALAEGRSKASNQQQFLVSQQKPIILLADFEEAMARLLPQPAQKHPREIFEHLNKSVTGQESAKKYLAVAVSNHYLRVSTAGKFANVLANVKKSNVLIVGPTGSGKTMLVETIAAFLDVPYVIFNSTVLTETGYTGASVEQVLYKLVVAADLNLRKAEYGIICIDEFDKLAFHQGERTRQTGAGVQQELLKIIDGTIVDVPKSGGERGGGSPESYQFNTRNILFVCLGAFNDIEFVIERRLNGGSAISEKPRKELLKLVQQEDLINFGFIPELIGRFPVVTYTEPLTVLELKVILLHADNGLVNEYKSLLKLQGWHEPDFDDLAVKRIAEEASRRWVGARGLRGIMEEVLLDKMFEAPKKNDSTNETNEVGQHNDPDGKHTSDETGNKQAYIDVPWVEGVFKAKQSVPDGIVNQELKTIIAALDKRLPGSKQAKQTLAIVCYNHYYPLMAGSEPKAAESKTLKQAVLLVDPYTGRRLQLVQELANILQVPCATVSAEQLERSFNARAAKSLGWLFEPIHDLLQKTSFNQQKAQQGIIFIDDFDQSLSKVSVQPAFNIQQQLAEALRRRSVFLQTGGGHEFEFKIDGLFFVLGGDFCPRDSYAKSFKADPVLASKYRPGSILSHLGMDFGISTDLLQNLIVAPMELSMSEEDLELIIKQEDAQLTSKYKDLLAYHHLEQGLSEEDYKQLALDAKDGLLKLSDIPQRLESMLMERLYNTHEEDASINSVTRG